MRFSIIIPTYNSSDYLPDCLNSLFLQDYPKAEYEIILVDDASTENIEEVSSMVLDSYILNNHCIYPPPQSRPILRLIRHDENKRQGGARNTGLKYAKGDYIFFLDSDDYWCATNTLSSFDALLKSDDIDIIRSVSWNNIAAGGIADLRNIEWNKKVERMTGVDHLSSQTFFYNIWTSCYNRKFLLEQGCFFRENVVYEDSDWSTKVFWLAQRVKLLSFPFYGYRYNQESTTVSFRVQSFIDNISSISFIEDFVLSVNMPDNCKRACYSRIKKSILSYIRISRNYPIRVSIQCVEGIRRSLLADTFYYDMSVADRVKFGLLLHCPGAIVAPVRILTLTKRFILKCLKK